MDWIAKIFGYILEFIYGYVGNFGIAIIIFTLLLKIIMIPMNYKQQKTMKKTAEIQKKVQEIQIKYAKDQERMNTEILELYKREKTSPCSGCFSSIIQMVIIISVFMVVSKPLTYINKLDAETINNYASEVKTELNLAENEALNYPEIAIIKAKSATNEDVKINMEFLGLDLSDIPSKNKSNWTVYILPVLYVITSVASMKITTNLTNPNDKEDKVKKLDNSEKDAEKKDENKNEEQEAINAMNKNMTYMMPIMSIMITMIAPLGLSLYWLLSNVLMIVEKVFVNFVLDKKEEK